MLSFKYNNDEGCNFFFKYLLQIMKKNKLIQKHIERYYTDKMTVY